MRSRPAVADHKTNLKLLMWIRCGHEPSAGLSLWVQNGARERSCRCAWRRKERSAPVLSEQRTIWQDKPAKLYVHRHFCGKAHTFNFSHTICEQIQYQDHSPLPALLRFPFTPRQYVREALSQRRASGLRRRASDRLLSHVHQQCDRQCRESR